MIMALCLRAWLKYGPHQCLIQKLGPPKIRRTIADYFRLYRSDKDMTRKMSDKEIRYIVKGRNAGKSATSLARDMKVTPRHVRRIYARYRRTGKMHVQQKAGRKAAPQPAAGQVQAVLDMHCIEHVGVMRTAMRLQDAGHIISYNSVYRIMKEQGLVAASDTKSGQKKWLRYERKYSNAMWHVDWHEMKDPRLRGLKLVTFLDDSSRCVTAARTFADATSENVVITLREAIGRFGKPATILSDNGRCFNGGRSKKNMPRGTWTPTAFEAELLDRGIGLINSRPYHPETNGKLERFHGSIEAEIRHYESLDAYIKYYNERRLHFGLDIAHRQTPIMAFSDKTATEAIRKSDPKWMERDINE